MPQLTPTPIPYGVTGSNFDTVGTVPKGVSITGTISATTTTVTGVGTAFTTELKKGMTIYFTVGAANEYFTIVRINSATQLVLSAAPSAPVAGVAAKISKPIHRSVVIKNTGAANGTVFGRTLKPGDEADMNRDHKFGPTTQKVINYDATGTTFQITCN